MITIKEIARESGYSITTVSRVLNSKGDVSPEARARIEKVVEKYHFVPNNNAKNLKQVQNKMIAVIVKGTGSLILNSIVRCLHQAVQGMEYEISVYYYSERDNEVERAACIANEKKPLGMLILGGDRENFRKDFNRIGIPCVLVSDWAGDLEFENLSSVSTDNEQAGKYAMDVLYDSGHKAIGILGGEEEPNKEDLRLKGCIDSMNARGLSFDPEKIYQGCSFSCESAYDGMNLLLEKYPEMTALFAMSDTIAIGAMRALADKGLKVPEDISVIGFDGIYLTKYTNPRLATIRQDYQMMTSKSLEILLDQIEHGPKQERIFVPFEFVPGESIRKTI